MTEVSGRFVPEDAAKMIELVKDCEAAGVTPKFHLTYFGKPDKVIFTITITGGEKPKRVFMSGTMRGSGGAGA